MATLAPEPPGSDNSITAILLQFSAGNREVEAPLSLPGSTENCAASAPATFATCVAAISSSLPRSSAKPAPNRSSSRQAPWQSRAHFFASASKLMLHILVDHPRKRLAWERAGPQRQVTLSEAVLQAENRTIDVLVLSQALERRTQFHPPGPAWPSSISSAGSTSKKSPKSS
jgi:hypothetical protein